MSQQYLQIGHYTVLLQRRARMRRLILRVKANQCVQVSAPKHVKIDEICAFVRAHTAFIDSKLAAQQQQQQAQYSEGAPIRLLGNLYRLHIQAGDKPQVLIKNDTLIMQAIAQTQREQALQTFYRQTLKQILDTRVPIYAQKLAVSDICWRIKKMKTCWGTCNAKARRLWFALQLAQQSLFAIDYVIVHELTHLFEQNHGAAFYAKVASVFPDWQRAEQLLNPKKK